MEFAVCGEISCLAKIQVFFSDAQVSFLFTMRLQRQIKDLSHSIELLSEKQRTEEPLRTLEQIKVNPSLHHLVAQT